MKILQLLLNASVLTESSTDPFTELPLSPADKLTAIEHKIEAYTYHETQAMVKLYALYNAILKVNSPRITGSRRADTIAIMCYPDTYLVVAPDTKSFVEPLRAANAKLEKAREGITKFKILMKSAKAQATKASKRDAASTPKVQLDPATIPKMFKLNAYGNVIDNPYFRFIFDLYAGSSGHFNYGKYQKQFLFLENLLKDRGYGGFKTTYASSYIAGGQPTFVVTTADGKINWYVRSRRGKLESILYPMDLHVSKFMTMTPAVLDQRLPVVKTKP